ncbi:hypothetical protein QWY79_11585 [Halomonas sabkhae]|uniref:PepSY domain-containing protein n=1 Tax=Halomonas sabkhae TaxID=626223 RepID=UPI0025B35A01|nr:PepSY domain-containing protein [Halomonas sabkhae]MDN3525903.1 hypothetical protein [Halomonas sabkhae]
MKIPRFLDTRRLRLTPTGCGTAAAGMLLCTLVATSVLADEDWQELHDAVQRGELVELPTILDWLQSRYQGEVLEVELERDDGATLYEIEMLGPQGQVVEFEFDAGNGQLVGMEGANINAMRKSP